MMMDKIYLGYVSLFNVIHVILYIKSCPSQHRELTPTIQVGVPSPNNYKYIQGGIIL